MNERIKEIAIEAGIISAEYNGFDSTGLTTAQRKFAELLIKECAEVAEDYDGAHYVGTTIKQHFGVE